MSSANISSKLASTPQILQKPSLEREMTIAGQDYVLVPKSVDKDLGGRTSDVKEVIASPEKALLATPAKSPGISRMFQTAWKRGRLYKTTLVLDHGLTTGTAATALATVLSADLTSATGFSSFLNLFDEVRVQAVKLLTIPGITATGAGVIDGNSAVGSVAFDPTDSTAVSSIAANLTASHHLGPFQMGQPNGVSLTTGQFAAVLQNVSPKGYMELGPVPLVNQLPLNTGGIQGLQPLGSDWVPVRDAAIITSYWKFYMETPTANIAWNHRSFTIFSAEFRMRG